MITPNFISMVKFFLTLVDDVEAGFVLGVVAVEEESGLMGGAKEGVRHHRATEPIYHCSSLQTPTAHLQVIMNGLCWEV